MDFVEFRDKFVAGVILLVQIALYPVHLLFRILARGLLIVLTAGFVPISLVLVVGFGVGSWDWLETRGWEGFLRTDHFDCFPECFGCSGEFPEAEIGSCARILVECCGCRAIDRNGCRVVAGVGCERECARHVE